MCLCAEFAHRAVTLLNYSLIRQKAIYFYPRWREEHFCTQHKSLLTLSYILGSYFAKDASYSDRYSSVHTTQNKIMFVALVLVGDYTRGSSSYVRPPQKANSKTLYDSCVDSESNPSIYVIFEKQQVYPEYLINYS